MDKFPADSRAKNHTAPGHRVLTQRKRKRIPHFVAAGSGAHASFNIACIPGPISLCGFDVAVPKGPWAIS